MKRRKQGDVMLNEFKAFIAKGNVMDMAVGIILGAAFTAIVTSLVDDLINPLLGLLIGGIDFGGLKIMVGEAAFAYGNFINAVIKFLLVAWVVFWLVKVVNRLKAPPPTPAKAGPSAEDLLAEIRDALVKKK